MEMRVGILRQSKHNNPHPRPDLDIEARAHGSGEVITRKMTEKDWAKYGPLNTTDKRKADITNMERNDIDMKHPHLTKEFFDAEFAKGKSGEQIVREQGLPEGSIGYYLKRAGAVNPNSRPFGTGGDTTRKAKTEDKTPAAAETNREVTHETTDSFIAATVERDQQILASKTTPKKSGRSMQIATVDISNVIETELMALTNYVEAMEGKTFRLEVSLVEVMANE